MLYFKAVLVLFIWIFILGFPGPGLGQNPDLINDKIDSLENLKTKIRKYLKDINMELLLLKNRKKNLDNKNDLTHVIIINLRSDGSLKDKPSLLGNILKKVKKGSRVQVFNYSKDTYFKVQVDADIGYMSDVFFPENTTLSHMKRIADEENRKKIAENRNWKISTVY